jgi:PAS domain S-box-containing protein
MKNPDVSINKDKFPLRYFFYFALIAIVIISIGYIFYLQRKDAIEQEFFRHIVAIKEIKLQQIESEQLQRKKIIESFLSIPSVNQELNRFIISKPNFQSSERISLLTNDIIINLGFSSVNIFNTKADLLFTTDSLYNIKQNFLKHELAGIFAREFSSVSNMYISDNKNLIQAVIVPIRKAGDVKGFLWAEYSFFEYLSPIIGYTKQEPGDIEFVLIKSEGDLAFVLKDVSEFDSTSIRAIPISKADRESLRSIINDPKLVKDISFRGQKIYASVKQIFGSDWNLITKINEEQVLQSVQTDALIIMTIALLLIILSASITYAIWKRSRLDFIARTFKIKRERDQLTERYTSLTRYANDIILTMDIDGNLLEANQRAIDIYGYGQDELLNMNFYDLSYNKSLDEISFLNRKNSEDGILFETVHKRKNGLPVPVEISARHVKQDDTEILLAIVRDNTERKKLQTDLIAAKERAEENDKLKTIILANMSHELNTPMSGILGFSEILQHELDKKDHKEMAGLIYRSSKRLNDTLTSILDLSKLESNKVRLDLSTAELNSFIEEIVFLHRNLASDKGIIVNSEKKKEKILIRTDLNILQKILNNILSNAIKFTENGEVVVITDSTEVEAKIVIKDTGIGISQPNLEKIFEPFRQASEGATRLYEGSGIGLTITKRFVEMLGGNISIESKIGHGTIVTLSFPLKK